LSTVIEDLRIRNAVLQCQLNQATQDKESAVASAGLLVNNFASALTQVHMPKLSRSVQCNTKESDNRPKSHDADRVNLIALERQVYDLKQQVQILKAKANRSKQRGRVTFRMRASRLLKRQVSPSSDQRCEKLTSFSVDNDDNRNDANDRRRLVNHQAQSTATGGGEHDFESISINPGSPIKLPVYSAQVLENDRVDLEDVLEAYTRKKRASTPSPPLKELSVADQMPKYVDEEGDDSVHCRVELQNYYVPPPPTVLKTGLDISKVETFNKSYPFPPRPESTYRRFSPPQTFNPPLTALQEWPIYTPPDADTNTFLGVLITGLPPNVTILDVLEKVRGGIVIAAILTDTTSITGFLTAKVDFLYGESARAYAAFVAVHPISFEGLPATVTLINTPTSPYRDTLITSMVHRANTRILRVVNVPPNYPCEALIQDMDYHHSAWKWESFKTMVLDRDGDLRIICSSVTDAQRIKAILRRSPSHGFLRIIFARDICSGELEELIATEAVDLEAETTEKKHESWADEVIDAASLTSTTLSIQPQPYETDSPAALDETKKAPIDMAGSQHASHTPKSAGCPSSNHQIKNLTQYSPRAVSNLRRSFTAVYESDKPRLPVLLEEPVTRTAAAVAEKEKVGKHTTLWVNPDIQIDTQPSSSCVGNGSS
jgi:hypothetical protein